MIAMRATFAVLLLLLSVAALTSAAAALHGDELDQAGYARLPLALRGATMEERVNYMQSISPIDDAGWWSACAVTPPVSDSVSSASLGARLAEEQQPFTRRSGKMERDASHRHSYTSFETQQPPSVSEAEATEAGSLWLGDRSAFALAQAPVINPKRACAFSASYRSSHEVECAQLAGAAFTAEDDWRAATAKPFKAVAYEIRSGRNTACDAWGWFSEDLLTSGWNFLHVESNPDLSDQAQARAAGFLEGGLTVRAIYEHKVNQFQQDFDGPPYEPDVRTGQFIASMNEWTLAQVAAHADDSAYWAQIGLLYQQAQGIAEGFEAMNTHDEWDVTYSDILLLQYTGDMSDIQGTVDPSQRVATTDPLQRIMTYLIKNGHCSVLIKLTDGESSSAALSEVADDASSTQELFSSHVTWAPYAVSHRMYKAYRLPMRNVSTSAVTFSSYPAFLSSTDDWYQTLETRLVVTETTNDIVNTTLYDAVHSDSVPSWARAVVATRLATNGSDWTSLFGEFNSGTYCNQWMVLDYKQFTPGQPLGPGTLWITEQLPGSMHSQDVTPILQEQTFWSSFNRPWFEQVYVAMGYADLAAQYGGYLFGYDEYFRAVIFKREQANVATLGDMQRTMQWNEWQTDPVQHNNSGFAIAARWDLHTFVPVAANSSVVSWFEHRTSGGIDFKATSAAWMRNAHTEPRRDDDTPNVMRTSVSNGPTHWTQPPFSWLDPEWTNSTSHLGLPPTYDFPFVQVSLMDRVPPVSCDTLRCNALEQCSASGDTYVCRLANGTIVGMIVCGAVVLLAVVILLVRRSRRRAEEEKQRRLQAGYLEGTAGESYVYHAA